MKKFYSFLFSACCVMAAFTLFSCSDPNEEDLEEKEKEKDKNKIEYIDFKEPYLIRGGNEDDIKAWMAKNMPEYELNSEEIEGSIFYYHKGNNTGTIMYQFYKNRLFDVMVSGTYRVEEVLDFLDKKYGDKELSSSDTYSDVVTEMYDYSHPNADGIESIAVVHIYGVGTMARTYPESVAVAYYFGI